MKKQRIIAFFLSALLSAPLLFGCNNTATVTQSNDNNLSSVSEFPQMYVDISTVDSETNWEDILKNIPCDQYQTYPNTHDIPSSATLYIQGEEKEIDIYSDNLVRIVNFYNNMLYYEQTSNLSMAYDVDDYANYCYIEVALNSGADNCDKVVIFIDSYGKYGGFYDMSQSDDGFYISKAIVTTFVDWLDIFDFHDANRIYSDKFINVEEGDEKSVLSIDWENIIDKIPGDHYEQYSNDFDISHATLYKNGEVFEIDIKDERLVRLVNFYNNTVFYDEYSYTQGTYIYEKDADYRLELICSPKNYNQITISRIKIIVSFDGESCKFVNIKNTDSVSCDHWPLHTQKVNYLDIFGF